MKFVFVFVTVESAVEYESTMMSVNEGANKVTVKVQRTNAEPNTPAVMVEVTPADGTAKKGNDFTISPTMKAEFKIGEYTADIEFTIVDDIVSNIHDDIYSVLCTLKLKMLL